MLDIYVDADACPVKKEVYRVARRCKLKVTIVSNAYMQIPPDERFDLVVVGKGDNIADDWIVENIQQDDICITADIPLAARCLKLKAHVLGSRGKIFTPESIGDTLATRNLMTSLREAGMVDTGGPPPLTKKDRSNFLNKLDQIIQKIKRATVSSK